MKKLVIAICLKRTRRPYPKMKKLSAGLSKKWTHGSENYRPHFHQFKISCDRITLSKIEFDPGRTSYKNAILLHWPNCQAKLAFTCLILPHKTLSNIFWSFYPYDRIKKKRYLFIMLGSSKPLYSYSTILRILLLPFQLGIQPIKTIQEISRSH